ncbi:hypothetical protein L7F22_063618 [Adiantum nelumboides]|nr:hypothetical protein [Adiantum nelumboides]
MADNNEEGRINVDNFDFANECASEETPMLVNYLITRLQQALANPTLQGEVQQQLQSYGFIPPHQEERIPEKSLGETSKRGIYKFCKILHASRLSSRDLEAAEKVLRFAQEMLKVSASAATNNSSEECTNDEQDTCPTCLEGYDNANPKRSTTCGHHFHLPCILRWMERCTRCPICRKNVNIRM